MNKSVLTIVIVSILIVGSLGFMILSRDNSAEPEAMADQQQVMMQENAIMKDEESMMEESEKMMVDESQTSRYIPYSKDVIERSSGGRRVLFFYANWCPTCRVSDPDFEKNVDMIPEDVTLIRVNYNDTDTDEDEKALAQKYGITYQHTFVQIDNAGGIVTRWNGGQTKELLSNIK